MLFLLERSSQTARFWDIPGVLVAWIMSLWNAWNKRHASCGLPLAFRCNILFRVVLSFKSWEGKVDIILLWSKCWNGHPPSARGVKLDFCNRCKTSGFYCSINEVCALLGFYTAESGSSLPTFQDNLSVPPSSIKHARVFDPWRWKNPLKVSNRLPVSYFRLQFRSGGISNERCNRN